MLELEVEVDDDIGEILPDGKLLGDVLIENRDKSYGAGAIKNSSVCLLQSAFPVSPVPQQCQSEVVELYTIFDHRLLPTKSFSETRVPLPNGRRCSRNQIFTTRLDIRSVSH